jgi:hypothetical protein
MPQSPKWSLSLDFLTCICIFHPSNACYMLHPFHAPWFDHPNISEKYKYEAYYT